MSSILKYTVDNLDKKVKIREYLKKSLDISSRFIKKASMDKKISVNGSTVKMNFMIENGDKIEINLSRDESQNIVPEKIDLSIVYEDDYVIVVNKPHGMIVHPTKNYQSGTLANGLLYYFKEKGENCIVRLVNRLDMDTSGLVLIAKNQFAHMALSRDMKLESFKKGYKAVVMGNMDKEAGTIDLPIYKSDDGIKRIIDERGQRSITHYSVEKHLKNADLVKLNLETGRTHQIRVHLSSIGHPICGDTLYGGDSQLMTRQALHAYSLQFPHPKDGRIIKLEIDIPDDIKNLIKKLED
ncbi:MAG: RluA family pseudouridine synthase [Clostridium sp.]|nr:RluA family pseudouridine synthase [Clostridium sp.]